MELINEAKRIMLLQDNKKINELTFPLSTRDIIVLSQRIWKIRKAINSCIDFGNEIYKYRYIQNLSWILIAEKMHISEITAHRYNNKLLQAVAFELGWI